MFIVFIYFLFRVYINITGMTTIITFTYYYKYGPHMVMTR